MINSDGLSSVFRQSIHGSARKMHLHRPRLISSMMV